MYHSSPIERPLQSEIDKPSTYNERTSQSDSEGMTKAFSNSDSCNANKYKNESKKETYIDSSNTQQLPSDELITRNVTEVKKENRDGMTNLKKNQLSDHKVAQDDVASSSNESITDDIKTLSRTKSKKKVGFSSDESITEDIKTLSGTKSRKKVGFKLHPEEMVKPKDDKRLSEIVNAQVLKVTCVSDDDSDKDIIELKPIACAVLVSNCNNDFNDDDVNERTSCKRCDDRTYQEWKESIKQRPYSAFVPKPKRKKFRPRSSFVTNENSRYYFIYNGRRRKTSDEERDKKNAYRISTYRDFTPATIPTNVQLRFVNEEWFKTNFPQCSPLFPKRSPLMKRDEKEGNGKEVGAPSLPTKKRSRKISTATMMTNNIILWFRNDDDITKTVRRPNSGGFNSAIMLRLQMTS